MRSDMEESIKRFVDGYCDRIGDVGKLSCEDIEDIVGSIFMYSRKRMGKDLMEFSYKGLGTFSYRNTLMFDNILHGRDAKYVSEEAKEAILKEYARREKRKCVTRRYEEAKEYYGDDFDFNKYIRKRPIEKKIRRKMMKMMQLSEKRKENI